VFVVIGRTQVPSAKRKRDNPRGRVGKKEKDNEEASKEERIVSVSEGGR